jgi:periplasmic glucans biosynthesis protein
MFQRRDFLKAALGGVAAASGGGAAAADQAAPSGAIAPPKQAAPGGPRPHFEQSLVSNAAADLAKKPFKAPSVPLPDVFAKLGYDQYAAIKNRPQSRIWASENVGFALEPLHRGFIFTETMAINIVENGVARRLVYQAGDFDFGSLKIPTDIADIGFSGFRVLQSHPSAPPSEVAVFQGASFFRAIANGQDFGAMSRGLTIRTADPRGEEFPIFREVWIEKPTLATNALIIHALLDSQSIAGAYRFTLRPGDITIMDAECTLFARTTVDNFGLSAMTGTHLLGPLAPHEEDVRPRVYDFSGLQMLTGKGEWLWRPVSNRDTLQISSFLDENPAGFGVLQRERNFQLFLDDDQHWELRPSVWVEPIGDWGPGSVDLVEIPSESEINQNVVAYWRPKAPLTPGSGTPFAYRQFWCWAPPKTPSFATTSLSRGGRVPGSSTLQRFLVEFSGNVLHDPDVAAWTANVTASPGSIVAVKTFVSPADATLRVVFDLDPTRQSASELRLVLQSAGKPMSETWLYRWTTT